MFYGDSEGFMLNGIKACCFDMDGTIIDSVWVWTDIDKTFLEERGLPFDPDFQKELDGMNFRQVAEYFLTRFDVDETADRLIEIWNQMALDKYQNEIELKPGVKEFLSKLKQRGIKAAIATSNSRLLAMSCLKAHGIDEYFDAIITGDDVINGKPAPDIYLACARACDVRPEECLVFEDIVAGLQAGRNAGMKTCAVYDEYSAAKDKEKRRIADYYIDSFTDI